MKKLMKTGMAVAAFLAIALMPTMAAAQFLFRCQE
jgi:hypothetical protein